MAIDIEKVLARLHIEGTKSGKEIYAKCPNRGHDDKDPSWRIRNDPGHKKHGMHLCWPCGFGGGVVGLVSAVLGISHADAKAWLGGEGEFNEPVPAAVDLVIPKPGVFVLPVGVVVEPLAKWVTPPRAYAESRGITPAQVDRWGLGWSIEGKLESRIVLPIRDSRGTLTGYTARSFNGSMRRYREPDENEHADRSVLFGEEFWPPLEQRACSRIYVGEGGINALANERALAGLYPAVAALSGSHILPTTFLKLASFREVVIFRDNDKAGRRVADLLARGLARHRRCLYVDFEPGRDSCDLGTADLRAKIFADMASSPW